MQYLVASISPVYSIGTDGFYKHTGRTLAAGTEVAITSKGIDTNSAREIGYLADGTILYLDRLTPIIETEAVVVQSTRLWDWLLYTAIAGGLIGFGVYQYKKHKRKAK